MTKRSKAYRSAVTSIASDKLYPVEDAIGLVKETAYAKIDSAFEVALKLGIDPRKTDQLVRGVVMLPHGTGKAVRVVVFATGPSAQAALDSGASEVGGSDLVARVADGYVDFDVAISTPELMAQVGQLGRVLGPRGLMPNPKTGTVTADVGKAVKDALGGRIEFKTDKHANIHFVIGKTSFSVESLSENLSVALDEINRARPQKHKGRYIKKMFFSSTFGPSVRVALA
ncbi:50S ribosomal protein L1 [Tropheryma whipplei]|uniref:Large ribosomal subunit protein uL1 n=2 Tax=Tropheryma whipplei TaxID=2039 RepID=RL1_TROWT|nr:50S ribosomal protein L1 [Tropheryma whipplei]P66099.1 RecName: Full=Large ribosomal subunit protein uL1; AltName: Full=50S ribosomal protein L1 [Tropheryma whipplei str. Twist]P66100.1 RecName: Full=Large ribosomal subunit protein uL1; AltName: Full=50S ribosomal protein L1 [Tropheryma whipplei TW08/27]AAO44810.1 50S ribosomal protein L1 [Tropheryma whipplei str. Twist]MCO8182472.1 50S ribosomal protein L1 [Tropheryma whipplei]MCO8190316.1 50S ribosomal protein L1 [Tropheryma whipplei]CAD